MKLGSLTIVAPRDTDELPCECEGTLVPSGPFMNGWRCRKCGVIRSIWLTDSLSELEPDGRETNG